MNNMNINIFGDILIHFGNGLADDLLRIANDTPIDETDKEDEESFDDENPEDEDIDLTGILISVEGMPDDVNKENVEAIVQEAAELLKEEMRKATALRKVKED